MKDIKQRLEIALKALKKIKKEGKVCYGYEICKHRSCMSSYNSWAIADEALDFIKDMEVIDKL